MSRQDSEAAGLPLARAAGDPTPGGGASTVGLFAVTGPASYFRSVTFQPHCVHLRLDRHVHERRHAVRPLFIRHSQSEAEEFGF